MFKKIVIIVICFVPLVSFAQGFSDLWKGYFSYFNIKEVVKGDDKIYVAAENAVFSYDLLTNEIEEFTTVNGLSGDNISTIYYSEAYDILMIGYESGLIELVLRSEEKVLTVIDIIDKTTIQPDKKRINHLNPEGNLVYISTNYGISVFDLESLEFGDTYFIGNSGSQLKVNQTTISNGYIYAACQDSGGLRKASVTNPNLVDFINWQVVSGGNYLSAQSVNNNLYAVRADRKIFKIVNDVLSEQTVYGDTPLRTAEAEGKLVVTTKNNVFVYNDDFSLVREVDVPADYSSQFVGSIVVSDFIYIGTEGYGVLKTSLNDSDVFEEIHPDGPLLNKPFSIAAQSNNLWIAFGETTLFFNPYPLNKRGLSQYKNGEWINTPFSEVLEAKCLNSVAINPFKTSQVFISSFFDGLLEVNNSVPTFLHTESNSGLESFAPGSGQVRLGASAFDKDGVLWSVASFLQNPLKSYDPSSNTWNSYNFESVLSKGDLGYRDIAFGNDGTKWVATYSNGVIGFNENRGSQLVKNLKGEDKNMPDDFVTALAVDKRNQLWIGTFRGLRVLYNTSGFFDDDSVKADEIIISDNGVAKELLFQQLVSKIRIDGSNNKWVGTVGSGVFLFSSDGQKTIFHFTKDNSPLPTNNIIDIAIEASNGTVYIATDKGLVSFSAGGSITQEDISEAYAYPNPVRPGFDVVGEKVKIKNISENINIKIVDIEGNLVAEAQSKTNQRYQGFNLEIDGGTAYWNGKNFAGNLVASGVYLVMLSDLDTLETNVVKLMVVR